MHVYKFINYDYISKYGDGRIIYIGKTKDIKKRMSQHFDNNNKNGHLSQECYKKVDLVQAIEVDTESDMNFFHKPEYNTALKKESPFTFSINPKKYRNKWYTVIDNIKFADKARFLSKWFPMHYRTEIIMIILFTCLCMGITTSYGSQSDFNILHFLQEAWSWLWVNIFILFISIGLSMIRKFN